MIETERLLLRCPRPGDDLSEFAADEEVQRRLGGVGDTAQTLLERWIRRWERNGIGPYVVELGGAILGRVGFIVWDARTWTTSTYEDAGAHAETELGWAILSRCWGRGYATEAARAVLDRSDLPRVVSLIDPRNERSARVAEKLGATPERLVETELGPTMIWVHAR